MRRPSSMLVPERRTTSGTGTPDFGAKGLDHAFGHPSQRLMPAKDVDEDRLDLSCLQHGAEGFRHAIGRGAAADVEKIRGARRRRS